MESHRKEEFKEALAAYPEFLSPVHLVKLGIWPSETAVYKAVQRGQTPPAIKKGSRGHVFPKHGLVSWLESHCAVAR